MQVRIRLFGQEAQLAGCGHMDLELPDAATCAQLRAVLLQAEPCLAAMLRHARIAVNHTFGRDDQVIAAGDELALIGMVSGG